MIKVGDIVRLKKNPFKLPKGLKVRLMAIIEYNLTFSSGIKICGAVIETHVRSFAWKYSNSNNYSVIEQSDDLTEDTNITFVTQQYLEPLDEKDDGMILYDLNYKWNVFESDWYAKWRKEYEEKYGKDPHKILYK